MGLPLHLSGAGGAGVTDCRAALCCSQLPPHLVGPEAQI